MATEIHYRDIGTKFKLRFIDSEDDSVIDVSAATTKQIKFKGPGGTVKTKTASFSTDGSDGYIEYDTIAGDLDKIGEWSVQGRVVTPDNTNNSEILKFIVKENL